MGYTERTLTNTQAAEARGWLEDCFGEELPANLTDLEIAELVDHHYEGGLDRFVRDAEILTRDYCPMCGEYLPLTYELASPAGTIVVCKFCATGEIPAAVVQFDVFPLPTRREGWSR